MRAERKPEPPYSAYADPRAPHNQPFNVAPRPNSKALSALVPKRRAKYGGACG